MPTPMPKEDEIERKWFVLDAEDQVLGRLASRVASILRGKHKPTFAPHLDVGDHVVVVNAEKVHLTGRKLRDKMYRWHSGYIGGLREVRAETMLKTHPERVIEWAVQGMLPKSRRRPSPPGAAAGRDAGIHPVGGPLMAAVVDRFYGTGRRKTSGARVWLRPG